MSNACALLVGRDLPRCDLAQPRPSEFERLGHGWPEFVDVIAARFRRSPIVSNYELKDDILQRFAAGVVHRAVQKRWAVSRVVRLGLFVRAVIKRDAISFHTSLTLQLLRLLRSAHFSDCPRDGIADEQGRKDQWQNSQIEWKSRLSVSRFLELATTTASQRSRGTDAAAIRACSFHKTPPSGQSTGVWNFCTSLCPQCHRGIRPGRPCRGNRRR